MDVKMNLRIITKNHAADSKIGSPLKIDFRADWTQESIPIAWELIVRTNVFEYFQGLATSIAILLHELPHELGDFAIYKKFGLSDCRALLFNFIPAMCSFAGLYAGLTIAHQTDASTWMLACVTGLFIYISLVDIVS